MKLTNEQMRMLIQLKVIAEENALEPPTGAENEEAWEDVNKLMQWLFQEDDVREDLEAFEDEL